MGLNIIADYHVHSNLACGKIRFLKYFFPTHATGTPIEDAMTANFRKLKEIAITDHGYRHPLVGMKANAYMEARKQIDEVNNQFHELRYDFKILLGAECNIISKKGDIDFNEDMLECLDILCAGYHTGSMAHLDLKKNFTEAAINTMLKYKLTILNHPIDNDVDVDIMEIGKAALKNNTALEINRKHKNITIDDIKKLKELGVKFSLGSDSHSPRNIGRFGIANCIALRAGLTDDDIINANGKAHENMKMLRKR